VALLWEFVALLFQFVAILFGSWRYFLARGDTFWVRGLPHIVPELTFCCVANFEVQM
jgi:hypothetical protein